MTCQECEIKLGMGEDAREHLASCEECRQLSEELRLNAVALEEMRVRPQMHWAWALAAAAAILLAIGLAVKPAARSQKPVRAAVVSAAPVPKVAAAIPIHQARPRRAKKPKPVEPLLVKMFTSDPDVVIYWIVGQKAGSE